MNNGGFLVNYHVIRMEYFKYKEDSDTLMTTA